MCFLFFDLFGCGMVALCFVFGLFRVCMLFSNRACVGFFDQIIFILFWFVFCVCVFIFLFELMRYTHYCSCSNLPGRPHCVKWRWALSADSTPVITFNSLRLFFRPFLHFSFWVLFLSRASIPLFWKYFSTSDWIWMRPFLSFTLKGMIHQSFHSV